MACGNHRKQDMGVLVAASAHQLKLAVNAPEAMTKASPADNVRGAASKPYQSKLPELLLAVVSQIFKPEIEAADKLAHDIALVLETNAEPAGDDAGEANCPVCRVE
jgi:hypothetical protein